MAGSAYSAQECRFDCQPGNWFNPPLGLHLDEVANIVLRCGCALMSFTGGSGIFATVVFAPTSGSAFCRGRHEAEAGLVNARGQARRPLTSFGLIRAFADEAALDSYYAGRVVVITGAASGIGRALAVRLAVEGAQLALLDVDGLALAGAVRQCRDAGARARSDTADVTDQDAMTRCAAAAAGEFGRVDLLVCAAGVIHTGAVEASAWEDTRRVIDVNLLGTMGTVSAFLPCLRSSDAGHAVLFSSGFGLVAMPRFAAYSASKYGVRGYAEALAQELRMNDRPVRVTCVYPGVVRTPIVRRGTFAGGEDADARAESFDRRALTEPEQAAEVILRRVQQGRARALVGADARAAWLAERGLGSAAQRLISWIAGRARSR